MLNVAQSVGVDSVADLEVQVGMDRNGPRPKTPPSLRIVLKNICGFGQAVITEDATENCDLHDRQARKETETGQPKRLRPFFQIKRRSHGSKIRAPAARGGNRRVILGHAGVRRESRWRIIRFKKGNLAAEIIFSFDPGAQSTPDVSN